MSDQQVGDFWKFLLSEFVPAIQKVKGVNARKVYSVLAPFVPTSGWWPIWIMLAYTKAYDGNSAISPLLGTFYGAMDLTTSTQMFIREVTPDLLKVLSS